MTHRAPDGRLPAPVGPGMAVIATGSRDFSNRLLVFQTLSMSCQPSIAAGVITVRHGKHARGADLFVHQWCDEQKRLGRPVEEDAQGAEWRLLGKAAGPIRNALIVRRGGLLCLAYYERDATNVGTDDCAGKAHRSGIMVRPYWSDEQQAAIYTAAVQTVDGMLHGSVDGIGAESGRDLGALDSALRKRIRTATGQPLYSFRLELRQTNA